MTVQYLHGCQTQMFAAMESENAVARNAVVFFSPLCLQKPDMKNK